MPLSIACNNEQQVPVTAAPVSAGGRPAPVDGPIRVTVQSGEGTFSQDAATPLEFKAISGDNPGETVYLVEADADLEGGVTLIQDLVTLNVTSAVAASLGFTAGPAEPKVLTARARSRR